MQSGNTLSDRKLIQLQQSLKTSYLTCHPTLRSNKAPNTASVLLPTSGECDLQSTGYRRSQGQCYHSLSRKILTISDHLEVLRSGFISLASASPYWMTQPRPAALPALISPSESPTKAARSRSIRWSRMAASNIPLLGFRQEEARFQGHISPSGCVGAA